MKNKINTGETGNKRRPGQRAVLLCSVMLLTVCIMLPFGLMGSIAAVVNTDAGGAGVSVVAAEDQSAEQIKAQIDKLKDSLEDIDAVKSELTVKIQETISKVEETKNQLILEKLEADYEIQLIQNKCEIFEEIIERYNTLISLKENEISETEKQFHKIYDIYSERLRQSYEEGLPSTLEIFLNSESFVEMLTSIERNNDITAYDARCMKQLDALSAKHRAEKQELSDFLSEQQSTVELLNAQNLQIEQKVAESQANLDKIMSDADNFIYQMQLAEEDRELISREIDAAVKNYHEALDKAEQKAYELTEEYKRAVVLPEIVKLMEDGIIQKGAEYFDDGADYIWPVPTSFYYKNKISSYYGYREYYNDGKLVRSNHKGIDIAVRNQPVYAIKSGVVLTADYSNSYGNYVVILHEDNSRTLYAHCSRLDVVVNEYVLQGEKIATSGDTGFSTGAHLHFEVHINGVAVNPKDYVALPTELKED